MNCLTRMGGVTPKGHDNMSQPVVTIAELQYINQNTAL